MMKQESVSRNLTKTCLMYKAQKEYFGLILCTGQIVDRKQGTWVGLLIGYKLDKGKMRYSLYLLFNSLK